MAQRQKRQGAFANPDAAAERPRPGEATNALRAISELPAHRRWFRYIESIVIIDFARRAHDHNWELDPITRSLLDTDFYKLLMLQFIWKHFPRTHASFTLINRTASVRLGEIVRVDELREQLESTRKLRFRKSELIWLAGNTFYGRRGIFEPAFLAWLEHDFGSPIIELSVEDGQILTALSRAVDARQRCGRSMRSRRSPS